MLNIACPKCSKEFQADDDFKGKFVECGSCLHQFTITEDTYVQIGKKDHLPVFKHSDLSQFKKTLDAVDPLDEKDAGLHDKQHALAAQKNFMPLPAWKQAMYIFGWGFIAIGMLLLIFGCIENGFLRGATYDKRFIIAGFMALISCLCFAFSARSKKGLLSHCVISIFLLGVFTYFMPYHELPTRVSTLNKLDESLLAPGLGASTSSSTMENLKEVSRYKPVERAIAAARQNGDKNAESVVAIWLKGASLEKQYSIQDYFKYCLGMNHRPKYYVRDGGALIILDNLQGISMQDVVKITGIFGAMDDIYVPERLIVVQYNAKRFRPITKEFMSILSDTTHDLFYKNNFNEVLNFDAKRVESALTRLENAPPRHVGDAKAIFLSTLNRYQDPVVIAAISSCLLKWYPDDLDSLLPKLESAAPFDKKELDTNQWPMSFVQLLLKANSKPAINIALELWNDDPNKWQNTLIYSRRDFSATLPQYLDPSNRIKTLSLINILSKSKSPDAKTALNSLKSQLDSSYQGAINNALQW